jgi:hypothetical protein
VGAAVEGAALLDAWPMTLQSQWAQVGARAWIAHSNESNVCVRPAAVTVNALS